MTKSAKIEMMVSYASRNGLLDNLLRYVQQNNSFQYERFADQLIAPEPSPTNPTPTVDFSQRRVNDLQRNIDRHYNLLQGYEEDLSIRI